MSKTLVIGLCAAGVALAGYAAYRVGVSKYGVPTPKAGKGRPPPPPPGTRSTAKAPGESDGGGGFHDFTDAAVDEWNDRVRQYEVDELGIPPEVADSWAFKHANPVTDAVEVGGYVGGKVADWIGI